MAIAGLKQVNVVPAVSAIDEAVNTTVALFQRLDLVEEEQALRASLAEDYAKLTEIGVGRLYVELPASVTFGQLIELANALAAERGYDEVYQWPYFWVPGRGAGGVTGAELNGSVTGYTARLALFSEKETGYDRLLHFAGFSYDEKYRERKQPTQLEVLAQAQNVFANQHPGASLRAADHRDFLVWYIMDLLREVSAKDVVLAQGFMRVPVLGRRTVVGGSCVGGVYSGGGRASFDRSDGNACVGSGVGLSAGFEG